MICVFNYDCHAGIAVAPPTDWLFYDTMYTERFMRLPTPEDNEAGYTRASLLDKTEMLRNKTFQINHGNADDNVHFQQSMMLFKMLEQTDIHFEQYVYPDENHGLGHVSRFLYTNHDEFWSRCLGILLWRVEIICYILLIKWECHKVLVK